MRPATKGKRKRLAVDGAGKRLAKYFPSGDDHDDFGDIDTGAGDIELVNEDGTLDQGTAAAAKPSRKKQKKQRMQKQQDVDIARDQAAGAKQTSRYTAASLQVTAGGSVIGTPKEQAAWLRTGLSRHSNASELETDFLETSLVEFPKEGSLEARLSAAAAEYLPQLRGKALPKGSPAAVVVTPAAMDAVHLIRKLPTFNKECRVAKLFAKHCKVAEQQQLLQSSVVGIACGTPNRLCKLADLGALSMAHCRLILLDVHRDLKQRTILDIPETRADLWKFLQTHVRARLAKGDARVALIASPSVPPDRSKL